MKGAIGAVMMNWGQPENDAVPFGSVKPVWGNPTPENAKTEMPTIPCIGIARTAGLQLREMAKKGPVSVWFRDACRERLASRADHDRKAAACFGLARERRLRAGRRPPGQLARRSGDRQRRGKRLQDGIGARVHAAPRQTPAWPDLRFLDGARNRHHGRLGMVRRPELGRSAQPLRGLPADRSARLHRHHGMGDPFERRAQDVP